MQDSLSRFAGTAPPPPPIPPTAAPGSEIVRITGWRCLDCADSWVARPDEGRVMEHLITLHQVIVHGDEPPAGRYHNRPLYLVRPPRHWPQRWLRAGTTPPAGRGHLRVLTREGPA